MVRLCSSNEKHCFVPLLFAVLCLSYATEMATLISWALWWLHQCDLWQNLVAAARKKVAVWSPGLVPWNSDPIVSSWLCDRLKVRQADHPHLQTGPEEEPLVFWGGRVEVWYGVHPWRSGSKREDTTQGWGSFYTHISISYLCVCRMKPYLTLYFLRTF